MKSISDDRIRLEQGDSLDIMDQRDTESVDIVVTSPPYNLNVEYATYNDNLAKDKYLEWTDRWLGIVRRILKPQGSLFLNIGGSRKQPWVPYEIAFIARKYFHIQNE